MRLTDNFGSVHRKKKIQHFVKATFLLELKRHIPAVFYRLLSISDIQSLHWSHDCEKLNENTFSIFTVEINFFTNCHEQYFFHCTKLAYSLLQVDHALSEDGYFR